MVATIETPRLILRNWVDSDVDAWAQMNADPRVTEFFARTYTREVSESMARYMREQLELNGFGWWAVEIRGGTSFAGVVALQAVPFAAPFTPANEIGWRFSVEHWGRGYATEAARAALDFAFNTLEWPEVVAFTAAQNLRSQRVMERLGMTHDPRDDFDHPKIERGNRLRRHVLYRIARSAPPRQGASISAGAAAT
jgi:RimJ/RimL family protein N-acetyltransferase